MRRADNLTTFMCGLSRNSGTSTSWNPKGLSRPVAGNLYLFISPDGKTLNQIHFVLTDRKWHLSVLDVRFFRGADCDADHYLAIAKVRERLSVRKQAVHKIDFEKFNLKELSKLAVRKQYQIEITKTFSAYRTYMTVTT